MHNLVRGIKHSRVSPLARFSLPGADSPGLLSPSSPSSLVLHLLLLLPSLLLFLLLRFAIVPHLCGPRAQIAESFSLVARGALAFLRLYLVRASACLTTTVRHVSAHTSYRQKEWIVYTDLYGCSRTFEKNFEETSNGNRWFFWRKTRIDSRWGGHCALC